MESSARMLPHRQNSGGLRKRLSDFVNAQLRRIGYAVVRIDGSHRAIHAACAEEPREPYDNLYLLDIYCPWLVEPEFLRIWQKASSHTLTDITRSYELYQCVREVAMIPGDILEVGVWRGGTGVVLAAAAQRWKPSAKVWLCDTFSGVVKARTIDTHYRGGEHSDTSPEIVASLVASLALTNTSILEGVFPDDTAGALRHSTIAMCHVDVDVYQSAADVITWLEPRMSSGGILVFDDYGFSTCKGITQFVNELRTSGKWIYIYNLNKHALLIKR
jgi:O-methyltransferase